MEDLGEESVKPPLRVTCLECKQTFIIMYMAMWITCVQSIVTQLSCLLFGDLFTVRILSSPPQYIMNSWYIKRVEVVPRSAQPFRACAMLMYSKHARKSLYFSPAATG